MNLEKLKKNWEKKIMKKVSVLIRVYNRLEDLEVCVDLINKNWNKNEYEIIYKNEQTV